MWIGLLEFDLLLGDVRSLKQKRSIIRPVVAELQRRFAVSAAETGSQDLHRRASVGMAVVSADRGHVDVYDSDRSPPSRGRRRTGEGSGGVYGRQREGVLEADPDRLPLLAGES